MKAVPAAFAAVLIGAAVPAWAAEVQSSTAAVSAPSLTSIYTVEKMRDPFMKSGGGTVSPAKPGATKEFAPEDFNIHNLTLKGLMKDAGTDYALLVDRESGLSFILRKGKLYDVKNKPVAGITGTINIKTKQVNVMTADKDVQVLRLGEEEEPE